MLFSNVVIATDHLVHANCAFDFYRREELCCLSGTQAQYPQFFFVHADGLTTYLGDYKMLQKIYYAEGLPRSYRDANPDISTWYQVFCNTSQIFSV